MIIDDDQDLVCGLVCHQDIVRQIMDKVKDIHQTDLEQNLELVSKLDLDENSKEEKKAKKIQF